MMTQGHKTRATALESVIVEALQFAVATDDGAPEDIPDPCAFEQIIRSTKTDGRAEEILGAIWLRLGLIVPRVMFSHYFGSLSVPKRIRVADAMLRLRKRMALRILGGKLLSQLLRDCEDSEFHRVAYAALNRVSVADAKDCLAHVRPKYLAEVSINLGRNMAP